MPTSTTLGMNGQTNLATGTDPSQDPNAAVAAEQNRTQALLNPPDAQSVSSSSTGTTNVPAPSGIIGTQMGSSSSDPYGVNAAQKAAQQVQPTQAQGLQGAGTMSIDPSKTSAGLILSMMAKDSPLKQQAETQALQRMNDRGLSSSSMAITAGQDAAYRAMTPLAQNDSQLYADASRTNANNQTQLAGINNQAQFQAARDATLQKYGAANMGLSAAYTLQNMDAQQRNVLSQMAAQHGLNIDTMNQQQLLDLAKMAQQQGYNVDTIKLQQSGQLAQLAAQHGYNLETMTEQQKLDLLKMAQAQTYNLETMDAQQRNVLAQFAAQHGYNLDTMSAQQKNDLLKMAQQQGYTQQNLATQQQNLLEQYAAQHGYNLDTLSAQQRNDLTKLAAQHANDLENIAKQGDITKQVANINTASAAAINETSHQYQALLQASGSAASLWSSTQNQIASIIQDKTLDASAKQKAIDTLNLQARAGLQMIGALAGNVDIGSFMDSLFGGSGGSSTRPTAGAGDVAYTGGSSTFDETGGSQRFVPQAGNGMTRSVGNGVAQP